MHTATGEVDLVRSFNRDYTRRIGLLQEGLYDSPYSLTEARVIYEIAQHPDITAAELAATLELDRGYLSRVLQRFAKRKLISRQDSRADARRRHLRLTAFGEQCFSELDSQSRQHVNHLLSSLDTERRTSVLSGMRAIQAAFRRNEQAPTLTLRAHRPGDMGWVVARHGECYSREYGWDERFEALVAEVVSEFITHLQPARERCWIAELEGQRVGCIFVVAKNRTTAKLRLLLVDPSARSVGLGARLIDECVKFARDAGYKHMELWTQKNLTAARHLYRKAGFKKVAQEPHESFGASLVGETWTLSF